MSQQKVEKVYPLTPMQEGMLYHAELDPDSSAYFTQLELHLSGNLDISLLQQSIDELVCSYDILRTVFVHQKLQRPRQVVFAERKADVRLENIAHMDTGQQHRYLADFKRENQAKGFDLAKDQLFRVAVFQLAKEEYYLYWSNHHILLDGWSLGNLMKRLFQNYETLRSNRTLSVESNRPYADYVKWLEKQEKEEALAYWERRLAGFEEATALPTCAPQSADGAYQNEQFTFVWDEELVAALTAVASRCQVTAPNLFQAMWSTLLAKYNNTDDVVFGTVVSGRPSAIQGIEQMVGLFINTIPVRLQLGQNATFADLCRFVQQNALQAERYDYVPLYEIQNRSALNHHLINHLLAFENYPLDRELENGNLAERLGFSAQVVGASDQTNYDFNLVAFPGKQWTIKMMYNASVYDRSWIERVAGHLTNLARAIVDNPELQVDSLSFLSDGEKQEILRTFNDSSAEYPDESTIHQLFEEQAKRVPDNVAVTFADVQMTYRELNAKANRLAKVLRAKGVGRDVIVAIMIERSVEMIVGMIAILKAGGAYLPIDPAYPADRIRFMLDDSGTKTLLTQPHLMNEVEFSGETLDLMTAMEMAEREAVDMAVGEGDVSNLPAVNSPDDLCYIIYTSGTTGTPKGVMTSHRNVVRLLFNEKLQFTFSERDTWTMFHSFCFDFSVWEMYGALLYGGKLVVVPKHVAQSPHDFRELLIKQQVTVLNQTPTAFASLIQRELMETSRQLRLRYVVFGGEALQPLMLKPWYEKYPSTKLINMYGITETTVHVTFKEIGEEEIRRNISNIGGPIPTLNCYIMDRNLNLLPVGVAGELCVSGLGVARGYLYRPQLTAERFVDDPYKPGEHLYRSGDLARFLPNGEIEYLGRIDHQVKIRGFRIELGEIEHQLLKLRAIREAVVLACTDGHGHQLLCAYIVADEELTVRELRAALQANLPDYMVPTHFVQLSAMPLTSNGKLDRKALPDPVIETVSEAYAAPTTETEQLLADMWQDVLGIGRVGIDDNFFSIGGHSLKAMLLATKIHQQFDRALPIKVLFERPTIRELAVYLAGANDSVVETLDAPFAVIEPAPLQPYYPVSSAQRRMYILNQLGEAGTSYNLPAALVLEGELDRNRLEVSFQKLIERHEILRTSFSMVDGTLVQKVHEQVPFQLICVSVREEESETRIREFIRPFDLQQAPLVRTQLLRLGENRHLLSMDMHHAISDGTSTGILVHDLTRLYDGENLAEPKLHYKDYAVWQNSEAQQERMKQLEGYWLDTLSGELPVLALPTDFSRPSKPSFTGQRFSFGIDGELAKRISQVTDETGTTLYMFLLSTLSVFLSRYASQEDIIVGSPVAGRTHAAMRDVPGMFVNTLALRSRPEGGKTFKRFLLEMKDTSLQAYAHQDYPFEELVEKLPLSRDTSRHPLFSVMFNLLNMDTANLKLGNVNISPYSFLPVPAKFDLSLEAAVREEKIMLAFDYATELYTEETIRRWSGHFLQIVQTAASNPDIRLRDIEVLAPDERRQLLEQSTDIGVDYPAEETIHALFEQMALSVPDRVAVVAAGERLTYHELDERANQLAHVLGERGIGPEDPVALYLDRSVDMMVAILAVLKAGGAYLPIDVENPDERIRFILEDSRARCLVTEAKYRERVRGLYDGEVLDVRDRTHLAVSVERPRAVTDGSNLAYIIYTSGTTGKPKGVMIEHRQVLHLMAAMQETVYSQYQSTTLNLAVVAPFHFDVSVQQIFASLLFGHTLFIVPKSATVDGRALVAYYRSHQIDVTDGTPVHCQMLLATGSLEGVRLRHMLVAGEALPYETVRELQALYALTAGSVPAITNAYGPTECCVYASTYETETATQGFHQASPYVPIGKPLGNNRMYILDAYGRLQPVGVPGELCVAGDGVGRGYLNLAELTAEKFAADPFFPGEIMYRTGDLVCRRTDGTIDFLGRMDSQVKIRGYRIELGEIETAMLKIAEVDKAVAMAISVNGTPELCAYYTADRELSVVELRETLSEHLPRYMVPSHFVQIDTFPLTSNGKIDSRALPNPDVARLRGSEYAAPTSDIEKQLCLTWQDALAIQRIGIDDDFFELGGHSLKAMVLIGNIQQKLSQEIPLKVLFERPTVRELARFLETSSRQASEADSPELKSGIVPAIHQPFYPVSPAQKRIYILHQMEEQGVSYNMPAVLLMEGELDIARLECALQALVDRHETLRTSFTVMDGVPVQKIEASVEIRLNLMHAAEDEANEQLRRFIRPFDLSSAPLLRTGLIRLSERRHLFLIDMHHMIADGASWNLFIKEIAQLYRGENLPWPRLQYKDYTMWLTESHQQEKKEQQEQYWLEQFKDNVQAVNLPLDFARPPVQKFAGDVLRFNTTQDTAERIRKLLAQTGTTFHMAMLAVLNVFLSKLSGQDDIVVGSAVAGRTHTDVMDMPGMFVNSLALRSAPKSDKTFLQLLQEVKETCLQALEHQDYPFEQLVGKLNLPRDMSRNPLFNVMLTVENPDQEPFTLDKLSIRPYDITTGISKFDLTLGAFQNGDGIGLQLEYSTYLFKPETVKRWSKYLLNVIEAVVKNPNIYLSDIEVLTADEKQQLLTDWNRTEMAVPTDKTIHQLFAEQVRKTPDRPAVTHNGRGWTYRELNNRSNALARLLIARGIKADDRVGIMVKPSLEMAAGVLAILKAGAAFVPIDASYPEERIAYILKDSGAQVLLTQTGISVPVSFEGEVMLLSSEDAAVTDDVNCDGETNPVTRTEPNHLAYIIYTSGTTGQPKGVMVEHNSLVNLCYWHNRAFEVNERDRSAKYAGLGFDASVWEMFPYWLAGADIHIIDESIRLDIVRLNEYFERYGITIAFMPTQLCEQFMEEDNRSLRILLTGGDKLKRAATRGYTLVNNYGPTEGTVVATSTVIEPGAENLSIGRPIANTRVYVLGDSNTVQPVGVAGELCIAGRGLARGYINRPEETAKKFVADPFVPGERMYRTGDLVRWLADGRIEYIGRIDQQVKVRGFRIELSEIEAHLMQHPSLQAAVVTDVQDVQGNTSLCAYVVAADGMATTHLQSDLARVLPEYMVPQYFVELDELPLTQNGKVGRNALPAPDVAQVQSDYKEPGNAIEALIAGIWQEVLGTQHIGVGDNFFALGGDSIKAIQMASRLHKQGWKLEMKDLFQHPTIEQVSPYLTSVSGKQADQAAAAGEVPLTPIQRWFFEQHYADMHHFNQSVMLHAPNGFDEQLVQQTLRKMVEHHDALRMVYKVSEDDVLAHSGERQYNCGPEHESFSLDVVDLREVTDVADSLLHHANRLQRSFDLTEGPLVKLALYKTTDGDHLLVVIHHLVVDGVSWRILLEDFASGYSQGERGERIVFQAKSNSFKDWAVSLQTYAHSEANLNEIDFWRQMERQPIVPLPKDNVVGDRKGKDSATLSFELSEEDTRLLLTKVHTPYSTEMNDILLCAVGLTIQEWTQQAKVCINLEGHGREEIIEGMDISRTVGWFTSQYPIVLNMEPTDLPTLIKTVKEGLRKIPNKGTGYGILRYLTANVHTADLDFSLTPEISFNYLGQFDKEVQTRFFQPSTYGVGQQMSPECQSPYALDFSGIVRNGRLVMSCSFNKQEYLLGTITERMNSFKAHLRTLIHHCATKEDRDFTPSDFTAGDLEMDEVGDIFDLLAEKLR